MLNKNILMFCWMVLYFDFEIVMQSLVRSLNYCAADLKLARVFSYPSAAPPLCAMRRVRGRGRGRGAAWSSRGWRSRRREAAT